MTQPALHRRAAVAQLLAGGFAAGAAYAQAPSSEAGRFEVAVVERMELQDAPRARRILTRAYHPAAPGRYPTIVFSHGFGGSMTGFANTGRIWASHGYVVLHPTHVDSVQFPDPGGDPELARLIRDYRSRGGAMQPGQAASLVAMLENPAYIASRLGDIAFLRDALAKGDAQLDAAVRDRADPPRMGMAGHSLGAFTTVVVAGGSLSPPPKAPIPRGFAGFLAISAQGPGRMGLTEGSFARLAAPMMMVTGTRDYGAAGETPAWRLKPYDLAPPGRRYAAVVEGFSHAQFDPPPGAPESRGATLRGLQLAFWDGALKREARAFADLDARAAKSAQTDPVWLRRR